MVWSPADLTRLLVCDAFNLRQQDLCHRVAVEAGEPPGAAADDFTLQLVEAKAAAVSRRWALELKEILVAIPSGRGNTIGAAPSEVVGEWASRRRRRANSLWVGSWCHMWRKRYRRRSII